MEKKKTAGLNHRKKNTGISHLSYRELRKKAMEPSDRLSDVVVVALGLKQDNSFSTIRRYLKSWKKIIGSIG